MVGMIALIVITSQMWILLILMLVLISLNSHMKHQAILALLTAHNHHWLLAL